MKYVQVTRHMLNVWNLEVRTPGIGVGVPREVICMTAKKKSHLPMKIGYLLSEGVIG